MRRSSCRFWEFEFFHLAGLEGFGFLKAGNLFLEGGNLVCVFICLGGVGLNEGGHFINLGVEEFLEGSS